MAKVKSSMSGFLMVVAFLVLTAIASVWYNGDEEQNAKLDQMALYQKAKGAVNAVLFSSQKLANFNLDKKIGLGEKIRDELETVDLKKVSLSRDKVDVDSWSDLKERVKEEWEKKDDEEGQQKDPVVWEKDENEKVFLITFKNGETYKIPFLKNILGK